MRTTLEIDDDILGAAKELARREKKTAGKVISELARSGIQTHRGKPIQKIRNGFEILPAGDRAARHRHARRAVRCCARPSQSGAYLDGTVSVTRLGDVSDNTKWRHPRDIAGAVSRAPARSRNRAPAAGSDCCQGTRLLA